MYMLNAHEMRINPLPQHKLTYIHNKDWHAFAFLMLKFCNIKVEAETKKGWARNTDF